MKAIKRLEQLLDEKDERIEALETEVQELTDDSEANWEWAHHKTLKKNPDDLPVPRLEIRWHKESDDGYLSRWDYCLIYRHTLDHIVSIPLGQTKTQGGNGQPPIYNGEIHTPFRDGVHICRDSQHLGLPAFAICDGKVVRVFMRDGKCAQEHYTPNKRSRDMSEENKCHFCQDSSNAVYCLHCAKQLLAPPKPPQAPLLCISCNQPTDAPVMIRTTFDDMMPRPHCAKCVGELAASTGSELLPCPFCGGVADVCSFEDRCVKAVCQTCGCQCKDTFVLIEDAIKDWNVRFVSAPDGKQVVSERAIAWLHANHPEAYRGFYNLIDTPTSPTK